MAQKLPTNQTYFPHPLQLNPYNQTVGNWLKPCAGTDQWDQRFRATSRWIVTACWRGAASLGWALRRTKF